MLASLFGAIIGGLFALVGGWLGLHWQTEREARGGAASLLAELSVAQSLLSAEAGKFYQSLIDDWKATGVVRHRQALVDMFDNDPQDTLPVYYSMVSNLGLLPKSLAADIVEYHAGVIALPRMIVRFLGKQELSEPVVREIAGSVEKKWHASTALRAKLILELGAFAGSRIPFIPRRRREVAGDGQAGRPTISDGQNV